jgi:hypothetical protein
MSMPGIAAGGAEEEGVSGAVIPGIDCAAAEGAGLAGIAMPGMASVAVGVLLSMVGIASGSAGAARLRTGVLRLRTIAAWLAPDRDAGFALFLGFAFAAGFAGIFMPGIAMPPMVWAAVMPGSIATAAAAASHRVRIILSTPGIA